MLAGLGVRIGYGAGTGLTDVGQVRDEATWAAAAGFDSFWVSQVFGVDPIVALAAVGPAVPGLPELGTSVVPLAGRHPLALAAQAGTAQSALDGRFTLGIGTSHQMVVEGFFGESYERPIARVAEHLAALLPLLDGRPADVAGDQVVARGRLTIDAAPTPVLLAALGPRMLELAGRLTAGTSVGSCGPRTIAGHIAPTINAAAERAGRPRPRIVALVTVCVTADPAAVRERGREQSRLYDSLPSYRAALDREGVASGADLLLAGTIDRIVDGLAAYADAGATDLRILLGPGSPDERQATREALAAALVPPSDGERPSG
ncbi:MAG TPA: TIGR03564 family F420-dependent LLM class oxidoreductase [Acidimicrobiales bacterium]|nr:TIGR03564 family F420-dependent LLM class oxidoreductase [Acidimicrobiales bacterium]